MSSRYEMGPTSLIGCLCRFSQSDHLQVSREQYVCIYNMVPGVRLHNINYGESLIGEYYQSK